MNTYRTKIQALLRDLGIPGDHERLCSLTLQIEPEELTDIERDIYGRPQRLQPEAAKAWRQMKAQAEKEGVALNIVSAFRSVERQVQIIKRKTAAGQTISEILKVCAAPGYSEHHTGRAVDLTTDNCEPLSESFETTEAFEWLKANAARYGFELSYPRDNRYGLAFEPWHWVYQTKKRNKAPKGHE